MSDWSSRERMIAALSGQMPDHVPCAFMLFGALKGGCKSYLEFVEKQLEMGLDALVELPLRPPHVVNDYYNLHGLPVSYHSAVKIKEWSEQDPQEEYPLLIKEYHTPEGILRSEVRKTPDWRWGDHVPFLDDYLAPRSKKFLITGPEDLKAFRYLLVSPSHQEIDAFNQESEPLIAFARRQGLLIAGGWGIGADLLGWVYGLLPMVYAEVDQPDFLSEMLGLIAEWNQARMQVVLDSGVDLYIRRAWYENCDFWSPRLWKKFIYPALKAEADLVHQTGARFGYIITSNCMPLLEGIADAGVDVIIGVDPRGFNLIKTKQVLAGKTCLWGGVNGHLTIEQGEPEEVRREVRQAIELLAPGGGFILSPVDNVREPTRQALDNVSILIDEWQKTIKTEQ
jgi:hypothetical protein